MLTNRLVIVGAGGHGRVVLDAARECGEWDASSICFVDDNPRLIGELVLGCPVERDTAAHARTGLAFHIAVGRNETRARLYEAYIASGALPVSIVHPRATVSAHSGLGHGVFVAAGAIVGPSAIIGDAVIVNHGAVVDHECRVGAFSHVAPNASLGGGVLVGDRTLVGSGAVILPGLCIGPGAVIGAGAVVTRDVAAGAVVVGIPARTK